MNILRWFKREPKQRKTFTVTAVEEQAEGYSITLTDDAEGIQYKAFMFYVHPIQGAVSPEPPIGAEAYRSWLDFVGKWMWHIHIGDKWWSAIGAFR